MGPATFAYDANGNLTSDGSTSFVYDVENRLVSASGTKNASLVYDPLGRLWQVSSAATGITRFNYDDDALVEESDGAGTVLRRYVHGPAKGVDDPLLWYDNATSSWRRALVSDQQGSIIAVADMHGNAIAINAYDEYGIPRNAQTGAADLATHGRFQYTGQAWIPELGLYYYKARFYSPTLGRFMQVDPIGYDDQINLYAYVGNDPLNKGDPSGQEGGCIYSASQCGARQLTPEEQRRREETLDTLYEFSGAKAVVDFFKEPSLGSLSGAAMAVMPAGKLQRPLAVIGHYLPGGSRKNWVLDTFLSHPMSGAK